MVKRTLFTAIVFLCCVQVVFAARLTLTDSVREVLDTNPAVLEKLKAFNASVAERERSWSGFLPVIDIAAETGYQDVKNSTTNFRHEDDWVSGASITLRQKLFDGGYTSNDVKAKSALAKARLFDYCNEANSTAFQSIEAYVNLLKYQRLYELAVENVDIHKNILTSVQARIDAGTGSSAELSRVQGRLAAAQSKLIMRDNQYKRAVYKYHQLIGRYVDADELVLPKFNAELLPANLKEAFDIQAKNHPSLIAADFNIETQKKLYKRDKRSYYPTLDLEASQGWSENYDGIDGPENDARILLKFNYRLYGGGEKGDLAQKNISLIHQQQQARSRIKRSVLTDLQLTWSGYKVLQSQLGALRKNMFFTKEALNSYKAEFRLGKRNLINILDAENEYQNARAALATTHFDIVTARYRVLSSMGTLIDNLELTSPLIQELKVVKKTRPATQDTLPLDADFDADQVLNNHDVSDNSVTETPVNVLGASFEKTGNYLEEPVERKKPGKQINVRQKADLDASRFKTDMAINLDVVSFIHGSIEMTDDSKSIMRGIIQQVKPLAMAGVIQISVASADFTDEAKNYSLSLQRGYNIMHIFAMHNMNPDAMQVFVNSPDAHHANTLSIKIVTDMDSFRGGFTPISNANIHFQRSKLTLDGNSDLALQKVSDRLKSVEGLALDIIVYCNDTANAATNKKLAQQRGEYIRNYLQQRGYDTTYCVPVAWGSYPQKINVYADSADSAHEYNKIVFILRYN